MPYPGGLPLHIWDDIAYLLDFTKDLLSLALTCRTFKDLIIPDHLEYRYISCDIRRKDVWQLLQNRPRLARGIRSLRLGPELALDRYYLPQILLANSRRWVSYSGVSVTSEHLTLFRSSLSYMTSLTEFVWKHNDVPAVEVIDISRMLTSIPCSLKALSLDFSWLDIYGSSDSREQLESLSIWNLTCLTKVVFVHTPGPATIQMLIQCRDIEDLSLWSLPNSPELFELATWKKLRRLHITTSYSFDAYSQDMSKMLISFFERHVNIESLVFAMLDRDISVPLLPSSFLPKLRSITWEANNVAYSLTDFLSPPIISHLVHWQCPIEEIYDFDRLPQMDRLESCHLSIYYSFEALDRFLGHAPNLKKLSINLESAEIEEIYGVEVEEDSARESLIEAALQCSKLTHFFSSITLMTEDNMSLPSTLRTLRFTELLIEGTGEINYVELERDAEGRYLGYHSVTPEKAGGSPESWGDFFLHL